MKDNLPNQDELLQALKSHAPRAMHVGELCGRLGISRSHKDEVVRALLLLAEQNLVVEMPGLRFRATQGAKSKKRGRERTKETRGRGRKAQERLDMLTKPQGSLGRLEEFAARLVAITGDTMPVLQKKVIFTFAGDHGVTAAGVSAFPSEVTPQMVFNFLRCGAGINVLALQHRHHLANTARDRDIGCFDSENFGELAIIRGAGAPDARHGQLARICLGGGDKLLNGLVRAALGYHEGALRSCGHPNIGKFTRLEADIFTFGRDNNVRNDHVANGVAIRLRAPKFVESDCATATGLVDDPYLDAKCLFQTGLEPTRLLIGSTARRIRNDERDGFIRIFRKGHASGDRRECDCESYQNSDM